jgi:hypothetical protein
MICLFKQIVSQFKKLITMAKISSYPQADVPLSGSDMLIGTDVVNDNETKNFTLSELAAFIGGTIGGAFVPYTGATGSVNLGSNSLTALNVSITGGLAANNVFGNSGQVLTSTGIGVQWTNFAPTLQQVLTAGRDLTNDRNFQGQGSGTSNTGISVIGFGINSASLNTGNNVIGLGVSSVISNEGTYVIGIGVNASSNQTGSDVIGIGRQASFFNEGSNVIGIGNLSANNNSGNHVNAIGQSAGASNTYNYVNLFGISAVATASNQTVLAGEEYQARLDYNGLTIDRQYDMPDANGTLVLSVNGTAPDAQGDVTIPSGWSLTGNSGTNPTNDFIGTTGAQDLILKTNSAEALKISSTGDVFSKKDISIVANSNSAQTRFQVYQPTGFYSASIGQNSTNGGYLTLNGTTGFNTAVVLAQNLTASRTLQIPNASGTLVASVNGVSADAQGNVVVTSSGGVQTVKVSLTSANILGLNGSGNPFLLIAAPGASKFLNVLRITARYNFGTTVYSTNSTLNYCLGLPNSGGIFFGQATSFLSNPFNVINIRTVEVNTTNTTAIGGIENQGLYVYCNAIAPTLGDGTVDFYITYTEENI